MTPAEFIQKVVYDLQSEEICSVQNDESYFQLLEFSFESLFKLYNVHKADSKFRDQLGQFVVSAINEKIEREKVEEDNEVFNKIVETYVPVKNPYFGPESL